MRKWIERVLLGLFAVLALGVPIIVGFLIYLGFSDGIMMGEGDPTRQTYIFMVRESRNFGIGVTSPMEVTSAKEGVRCFRMQFTHLRLRGQIGIERSSNFCTCYVRADGKWVQDSEGCKA